MIGGTPIGGAPIAATMVGAAAAVANGILALVVGYTDFAAPAELPESFTPQIIEAAPAPAEAPISYWVTDPDDDVAASDGWHEPLPTHEMQGTVVDATEIPPPVLTDPVEPDEPQDAVLGLLIEDAEAPDLTQIPGPVVVDQEAEDPPEESIVTGVTEDPPTDQPEYIVQWATDLEPETPQDAYTSLLAHLAAPEAGDTTEIPPPAITDLVDDDELQDAVLGLLFGEAPETAAVLALDFPDEIDAGEEPLGSFIGAIYEDAEAADLTQIPPPVIPDLVEDDPIEDAVSAYLYEDAATPDLTFVAGWQDDFLRDYEQQREDEADFALLGMVFDPYGQVDDTPPVVTEPSAYIPPFRRRRR